MHHGQVPGKRPFVEFGVTAEAVVIATGVCLLSGRYNRRMYLLVLPCSVLKRVWHRCRWLHLCSKLSFPLTKSSLKLLLEHFVSWCTRA